MAGHDANCGADQATFWRDPVLGGTEFLHARFVSYEFAPHTHDEYAIGVIVDGIEAYRYRRRDRFAEAGEIVVVEPGEAHTGKPEGPGGFAYRMFYVPAHLLANAAEAVGRRTSPHFPKTVLHDPELASAMRAMHVASQRLDPQLERESRFASLLTTLVERHTENAPALPRAPAASAPIRRAIELANTRYAEPVTLGELALSAGMSDFHFARLFTRATGLSPHRYVVQRRLLEARRLLREGASPADVALRVGFADQAHLTRHFKRIMGVTPARFALGRAESKNVQDPAERRLHIPRHGEFSAVRIQLEE